MVEAHGPHRPVGRDRRPGLPDRRRPLGDLVEPRRHRLLHEHRPRLGLVPAVHQDVQEEGRGQEPRVQTAPGPAHQLGQALGHPAAQRPVGDQVEGEGEDLLALQARGDDAVGAHVLGRDRLAHRLPALAQPGGFALVAQGALHPGQRAQRLGVVGGGDELARAPGRLHNGQRHVGGEGRRRQPVAEVRARVPQQALARGLLPAQALPPVGRPARLGAQALGQLPVGLARLLGDPRAHRAQVLLQGGGVPVALPQGQRHADDGVAPPGGHHDPARPGDPLHGAHERGPRAHVHHRAVLALVGADIAHPAGQEGVDLGVVRGGGGEDLGVAGPAGALALGAVGGDPQEVGPLGPHDVLVQPGQARVGAGESARGGQVGGQDDADRVARPQPAGVAGDAHVAEAVEGEGRLEDLRRLGRARARQDPRVALVLVGAHDVGEEGAVGGQVLGVLQDDLGAGRPDGGQAQPPGDDLPQVEDRLARGRGEDLRDGQRPDPARGLAAEGLQARGRVQARGGHDPHPVPGAVVEPGAVPARHGGGEPVVAPLAHEYVAVADRAVLGAAGGGVGADDGGGAVRVRQGQLPPGPQDAPVLGGLAQGADAPGEPAVGQAQAQDVGAGGGQGGGDVVDVELGVVVVARPARGEDGVAHGRAVDGDVEDALGGGVQAGAGQGGGGGRGVARLGGVRGGGGGRGELLADEFDRVESSPGGLPGALAAVFTEDGREVDGRLGLGRGLGGLDPGGDGVGVGAQEGCGEGGGRPVGGAGVGGPHAHPPGVVGVGDQGRAVVGDPGGHGRGGDLDAAGRPGRLGRGGAGRVEAAHLDLVGPRRRGPGHLPRQDRAGDGDADGGAEMVDGEVHGCATREGRRVPTGAGRSHVVPIARR